MIRWGWMIARRNITHLGLATASVALAVTLFIGGAVLTQGVPGGAARVERAFVGGDILVHTQRFLSPHASALPEDTYSWDDWQPALSPYLAYFPEYGWHGSPAVESASHAEIVEVLAENPDVEWIYPYVAMPVFLEIEPGKTIPVLLRARRIELDAKLGLPDYVVEGSYLESNDAPGVVVDGHRPNRQTDADRSFGYDRFNGQWLYVLDGAPFVVDYEVPEVGKDLVIHVPKGLPGNESDLTKCIPVQLTVSGIFKLPTREMNWLGRRATGGGLDLRPEEEPPREGPWDLISERLFWSTPELLVSWDTFTSIWRSTGHRGEPQPLAYAVRVSNLPQLNSVTEELRTALPGSVVAAIPELVALRDFGPEALLAVPKKDVRVIWARASASDDVIVAAPAWVRTCVVTLGYLIAGILFAANTIVIVHEQRAEIALMMALGAHRYQAATVIFVQLGLVSVLGLAIGTLIMAPPAAWQWGTAGMGSGELLAFLSDVFRMLLMVSLGMVAVFGGLPVLWATLKEPSEVLKNA